MTWCKPGLPPTAPLVLATGSSTGGEMQPDLAFTHSAGSTIPWINSAGIRCTLAFGQGRWFTKIGVPREMAIKRSQRQPGFGIELDLGNDFCPL